MWVMVIDYVSKLSVSHFPMLSLTINQCALVIRSSELYQSMNRIKPAFCFQKLAINGA